MAEEIDKLNYRLKRIFGSEPDGRAKFRIVFSSHEYEHRFGLYRDLTPSGILIREVEEVRLVPKYMTIRNKWILEQLIYEPHPHLPDQANGHYEQRLAFKQDENGKPLKPTWNVLAFVCLIFLEGPVAAADHFRDQDEEDRKKFIEEAVDILDDEVPFLAGKLAAGTAVVNPGVTH